MCDGIVCAHTQAIARLRESSGYGVSHGMMQPPVVSPGPLDTSVSTVVYPLERLGASANETCNSYL